ncbi:hypothetical protein TrST_g907 [Triparma strigata]|uniref:PX domain-containing protein n=1 Tax=Triparma strigata TaxID=1606541 RepID=A0A9W7BZB9_9STRA|nr:hypothetical protein TrST_g907 [Triparma strigata]
MDAIICSTALVNASTKLVEKMKEAGAGAAQIELHRRDVAHAETDLKLAKEAAAKAGALVDLDLTNSLTVNVDVKGWEVREADGVTVYLIETAIGKKETWLPVTVKHRYNDFVELHHSLEKQNSFPVEKCLFHSNATTDKRAMNLKVYLLEAVVEHLKHWSKRVKNHAEKTARPILTDSSEMIELWGSSGLLHPPLLQFLGAGELESAAMNGLAENYVKGGF